MISRTFTFVISGLSLLVLTGSAVWAGQLSGNVETKVKLSDSDSKASLAKKSSKSKVIEGGIKDGAALKPSVKLFPKGKAPKKSNSSYLGNVEQFAGGRMYSPGNPAPRRSRMFPKRRYSRRSHSIRPITNYTLTPRNGVMTFGGHGVIKAPSYRSVTSFSRGHSVSSPRSVRGVTTFVPGYETVVKSTYRPPRRSLRFHRTRGTHSGITSWLPGFSTNLLPYSVHSPKRSRNGITAWAPGYSITKSTVKHGSSVTTPGQGVTRIAYNKGVSSWAPGYQVTVQTNGGYKTSLGGKWFDSSPKKEGLRAKSGSLIAPGTFVQPVLEAPLLAKANLLPGLRNGALVKNISWDDWYRSVATSIYNKWQYKAVGPGTAKVRVTVTAARELTCQVVDFIPAADVKRNVDEETEFRVSALRAVNSIKRDEIPAFPPLADKEAVTFDVVLKRKVDGPIGIDVSKLR